MGARLAATARPGAARRGRRLLGWVVMVAACSPTTTRPDFKPFPQALTAVLTAPPERIVPVVDSLVEALGVRVWRASVVDGYLETDWYDPETKRSFGDQQSVPDSRRTVKLRCWADPYVPGETTFTVEVAYRPRVDPSRVERDLEAVPPDSTPGRELARQLLDEVKKRVGTPAATTP
jgi:hypothetical protein